MDNFEIPDDEIREALFSLIRTGVVIARIVDGSILFYARESVPPDKLGDALTVEEIQYLWANKEAD